jgi:hypothetical protein
LDYDSLTVAAQTVLREEFAHRGLEPPLLAEPAPEIGVQSLLTVEQYRDLAEAQLAKAMRLGFRVFCAMRIPCEWSGCGRT